MNFGKRRTGRRGSDGYRAVFRCDLADLRRRDGFGAVAGDIASFRAERDASIEDQIRLCRQYIEREGWHYRHAYTDRAVSGASALRPAYQALLEDARRGEFDVVVAEALDRLSRDQEDVAGLLKRLRFAGVRLFTLAEGEIGELHVGLKGTMNAPVSEGPCRQDEAWT